MLLPEFFKRHIDHDPPDPTFQRAIVPERLQVGKYFYKSFLKIILGFGCIFGITHTYPKHLWCKMPVKRRHCFLVASDTIGYDRLKIFQKLRLIRSLKINGINNTNVCPSLFRQLNSFTITPIIRSKTSLHFRAIFPIDAIARAIVAWQQIFFARAHFFSKFIIGENKHATNLSQYSSTTKRNIQNSLP